jgi:4-amino-4-deoxy-L-arabinose transferase-like glycosyltransferase
LIYRLRGERHAIVATALLAIMPGVVMIDRTFIPDPAMVALLTASVLALVLYLQTDRDRYLVIAVAIGTWANLTKLPGMIVGLPMAYAAVSILRERGVLRSGKVARLSIAALASALPVAAYYLWARHLSLSYPPYHFAGEGNWIWDQGLRAWIEQRYFLPRLRVPVVELWGLPAVLMVVVAVVLVPFRTRLWRWRATIAGADDRWQAPWMFHWWLAGGVVYYAIGARELVENPSNLHVLSPAVAALAAQVLIALSAMAANQMRRPGTLMVIALAFTVAIGIRAHRVSRLHSSYAMQSYKLGSALKAVSRDGDLVVALGDVIGCPVAIYYSGRRGWLFPPFEAITNWEQLPPERDAIAMFDALRASGADWFAVVNRWDADIWSARPNFARHIDQSSELVKAGDGFRIYRLATAAPSAPRQMTTDRPVRQ